MRSAITWGPATAACAGAGAVARCWQLPVVMPLPYEGQQNITVYNSSDWAERGFCSRCGSHLFYRLKESGEYYMPVGLFDSMDHFSFDHQVFIDEKPDFYRFANKTEELTGDEVFARYTPPE